MLKSPVIIKVNFLLVLLLSVFFFIVILPLYSFATIPQKPQENNYVFDYADLIDDSDENEIVTLAKK